MKRHKQQPPTAETSFKKLLEKLQRAVESYQQVVKTYEQERRDVETKFAEDEANKRSAVITIRREIIQELLTNRDVLFKSDEQNGVKHLGHITITIRKKRPGIIITDEQALIQKLLKEARLRCAIKVTKTVDRNILAQMVDTGEELIGMTWGPDESLTIDFNHTSLEQRVIALIKGIPLSDKLEAHPQKEADGKN